MQNAGSSDGCDSFDRRRDGRICGPRQSTSSNSGGEFSDCHRGRLASDFDRELERLRFEKSDCDTSG